MKTTSAPTIIELQTPRIIALAALAVLLLLTLTGCEDNKDHTSSINPAGVYILASVNGKVVPCDITHEGTSMNIKSGIFTITADGNCRSLMTISVPTRDDIKVERKATYIRHGTELTMQWEGAGVTLGAVSNNTFTMTNEGIAFVYRK